MQSTDKFSSIHTLITRIVIHICNISYSIYIHTHVSEVILWPVLHQAEDVLVLKLKYNYSRSESCSKIMVNVVILTSYNTCNKFYGGLKPTCAGCLNHLMLLLTPRVALQVNEP